MPLDPENVQTYPRPPALEPVPQEVRVECRGTCVARTGRALRILETHHAPTYYIPRGDVSARLVRAPGGSFCEWKGQATYWSIVVGGATLEAAAWSYEQPSQTYADLAGHVAFYPGRVDACWVGDAAVTPQPGDFYGGWVTPNLTGIVKGSAETRHW